MVMDPRATQSPEVTGLCPRQAPGTPLTSSCHLHAGKLSPFIMTNFSPKAGLECT